MEKRSGLFLLLAVSLIGGCAAMLTTSDRATTASNERNRKTKEYRDAVPVLLQARKCDELVAKWEAAKKDLPLAYEGLFWDYSLAIAKCDRYDTIIEEFVNRGDTNSAIGYQLLHRLLNDGLPIREKILEYLRTHEKIDFSRYLIATERIVKFFLAKNWKEHGEEFMKILDVDVKNGLWYMNRTKYKGAVPRILEFTFPKWDAGIRERACNALGEIGDRSALPRLKVVAEGDPAFVIRRGVTLYYVREAAKGAIYKIEQRQ